MPTAVAQFLDQHPETAVDVVGFHGHTILHRPADRRTWQIGDGALLARLLGWMSSPISAPPMLPRAARARRWRRCSTPRWPRTLPKPIAVLNIGGVANVTLDRRGPDEILAFDTGPGNALIDDWVRRHTGAAADIDGALARAGSVSAAHVDALSRKSLISPVRRRNRSTATISATPCPTGFRSRTGRPP